MYHSDSSVSRSFDTGQDEATYSSSPDAPTKTMVSATEYKTKATIMPNPALISSTK